MHVHIYTQTYTYTYREQATNNETSDQQNQDVTEVVDLDGINPRKFQTYTHIT